MSGDPYVRKQAQVQQKADKRLDNKFQSEEAKALDIIFREVGILSN